MGHAIILLEPAGTGVLAGHPYRVTGRLLARVLGRSLDGRLAAGESPESGWLLATRARLIVAPCGRARLARNWEHVLDVARRAPAAPGPAFPLRRAAVMAAQPRIRDLAARLRAPLPVGARGVAVASTLLTSAGGPLYHRNAAVSLEDALQDAIAWLDPALPLMTAA